MQLLDLDAISEQSASNTTRSFDYLMDISFSTVQSLEQAVFASIILQSNISPLIRGRDKELAFLYHLVQPVQEAARDRLRYNTLDFYPAICERCFTYFGKIVGGLVFHTGCVWCVRDFKINTEPLYKYYGFASHYVPREEIWHGQQTTIITALLLHKYFKQRKIEECISQ